MTDSPRSTDALRFDPDSGLLPAVVQDARSGRVLMLGYMNREALERTRATGRVTFFSRERGRLWTKGETSGNTLELVEVRADCDADALLIRAVPHGPTCHTGQTSCFGETDAPDLGEVLGELFRVIEQRKSEKPEGSYTVRLLDQGLPAIGRKVTEEAAELTIEAVSGGARPVEEAADLLYHVLVLLAALGRTPEEVARELRARRR
ncbi:MAG: bifunctional phosphoribosyl-AMP cyclohydrolase/phosphoribosyl-ATP diphosphatase HisIE [Gemmatimonadota bacterium]